MNLTSSESEIMDELRRVIRQEAQAVSALPERINGEYARAVRVLMDCKGKIVVSGIGKSGFIARKIASTFSSVGSTSYFLHPAEALHGDLGTVTASDVLLVLSKSGESLEVNEMLTVVHRIGAKIIAMTENCSSTMASMADIVLDTGTCMEACPLNLAPTSSTTISLVLGDALAVTLMKMRGFGEEDFALRHPAGRLGRRLLAMVREVMLGGAANPVIAKDTTVADMIATITEKQAGAVSVVDDEGRFLGLITDYDIRASLQSGKNPFDMTITELMNPNPTCVDVEEKAYNAYCIMQGRAKPITVLPVLDKQKRAVGMLRLQDLVALKL